MIGHVNAFHQLGQDFKRVTAALDNMAAAIREALGDTYALRRGMPTRRQMNLMQAKLDRRQGASDRAMRRMRTAQNHAHYPQLLHKGGKP